MGVTPISKKVDLPQVGGAKKGTKTQSISDSDAMELLSSSGKSSKGSSTKKGNPATKVELSRQKESSRSGGETQYSQGKSRELQGRDDSQPFRGQMDDLVNFYAKKLAKAARDIKLDEEMEESPGAAGAPGGDEGDLNARAIEK